MRVLLDTCALVPGPIRHILLEAAMSNLFTPLWSEKIFEEWQFVALKSSEQAFAAVKIEILLMRGKWRNSLVCRNVALESTLVLPDINDRHVLAAAIVGKADLLLTNNLKDFPSQIISRYGLTRKNIDTFLLELFTESPYLINNFVDRAFDSHKSNIESNPTSKKSFLKKYGLSRLAKCIVS